MVLAEGTLIIFIFAFGACVGSFLNVVIYRMPRGESIAFPSSHCPKCGRGIRWYDNLPIISWLALRGRCRHCGVKISPQYILVEAFTGMMVVTLYLCYFTLIVRRLGYGPENRLVGDQLFFGDAWPMFIAHAAMLCGLLACAAVDIKHYVVPLPVMWVVALIGAAAAAYRPHGFLPPASAEVTAMSLAAGVGLLVSLLAIEKGWLTPSFLDASDPIMPEPAKAPKQKARTKAPAKGRSTKSKNKKNRKGRNRGSVGATKADGVDPRVEVLREVLFLVPATALAVGVVVLLRSVPSLGQWWSGWFDAAAYPRLAPRMGAVGGSLFGFLIGGAWIWGIRILATLGFGREAMGMGDVHILAGVGAVTGWVVPSIAFFVAPISGILIVLYLFFTRRQRELPYGPWLAAGTLITMLCYDTIVEYLAPGLSVLFGKG